MRFNKKYASFTILLVILFCYLTFVFAVDAPTQAQQEAQTLADTNALIDSLKSKSDDERSKIAQSLQETTNESRSLVESYIQKASVFKEPYKSSYLNYIASEVAETNIIIDKSELNYYSPDRDDNAAQMSAFQNALRSGANIAQAVNAAQGAVPKKPGSTALEEIKEMLQAYFDRIAKMQAAMEGVELDPVATDGNTVSFPDSRVSFIATAMLKSASGQKIAGDTPDAMLRNYLSEKVERMARVFISGSDQLALDTGVPYSGTAIQGMYQGFLPDLLNSGSDMISPGKFYKAWAECGIVLPSNASNKWFKFSDGKYYDESFGKTHACEIQGDGDSQIRGDFVNLMLTVLRSIQNRLIKEGRVVRASAYGAFDACGSYETEIKAFREFLVSEKSELSEAFRLHQKEIKETAFCGSKETPELSIAGGKLEGAQVRACMLSATQSMVETKMGTDYIYCTWRSVVEEILKRVSAGQSASVKIYPLSKKLASNLGDDCRNEFKKSYLSKIWDFVVPNAEACPPCLAAMAQATPYLGPALQVKMASTVPELNRMFSGAWSASVNMTNGVINGLRSGTNAMIGKGPTTGQISRRAARVSRLQGYGQASCSNGSMIFSTGLIMPPFLFYTIPHGNSASSVSSLSGVMSSFLKATQSGTKSTSNIYENLSDKEIADLPQSVQAFAKSQKANKGKNFSDSGSYKDDPEIKNWIQSYFGSSPESVEESKISSTIAGMHSCQVQCLGERLSAWGYMRSCKTKAKAYLALVNQEESACISRKFTSNFFTSIQDYSMNCRCSVPPFVPDSTCGGLQNTVSAAGNTAIAAQAMRSTSQSVGIQSSVEQPKGDPTVGDEVLARNNQQESAASDTGFVTAEASPVPSGAAPQAKNNLGAFTPGGSGSGSGSALSLKGGSTGVISAAPSAKPKSLLGSASGAYSGGGGKSSAATAGAAQGGLFSGAFGGLFGGNSGDAPAGTGSNGEEQFGNASGEVNPMGSEDPEDYLTRILISDDIFKVVERRYQKKAKAWYDLEALRK